MALQYATFPQLGVQPAGFTNAANTVFQSGQSPFANQSQPLGTIRPFYDPVLGAEGEAIYLLGVVNTVLGLMVTWDISTFQTTVLPVTAQLNAPVAVALSANVAGNYGWYQISGMATILKTAIQITPTSVPVFISGTAGRIFVTSTAGREIMGARTANVATVTSTTSTVLVHLAGRPFAQGHIT